MADILGFNFEATTEEAKRLQEQLNGIEQKLRSLPAASQESRRALELQRESILRQKDAIAENIEKWKLWEQAQQSLGINSSNIQNALGGVKRTVDDIGNSIGQGLIPLLKTYGGTIAAAGSQTIRDFINPFKESKAIINETMSSVSQQIQRAFGNNRFAAEFARRAVEGIKGLNEVMSELLQKQNLAYSASIAFGESLSQAEQTASQYTQGLRRATAVTGMSANAQEQLYQVVSKVPRALEETNQQFIDMFGAQSNNITKTVALATALRALGIDGPEAANFLVQAYEKFGDTQERTARQLGVFAGALEGTGVRADLAFNQMVKASDAVAKFGTGAATAARTWRTFVTGLRDTAVPIGEVGNMVTNLTRGIANMSLENRAFIGMLSGMFQGAGALGGALRMELQMRSEGGLERNIEALTTSLARFGGGQIITLQQAVDNPALQAQFQIQRQMLSQLAGITDQEQQSRILEVLQGVQRGGISQVEGGKQLSRLFERGQSIGQRQLTFLQQIANNTRAMAGGRIEESLMTINNTLQGRGAEAGVGRLTNALINTITRGAPGRELETAYMGTNVFETLSQVIREIPENMRLSAERRGPVMPQGTFTQGVVGAMRRAGEPIPTRELSEVFSQIAEQQRRTRRADFEAALTTVKTPELAPAPAPATGAIPATPGTEEGGTSTIVIRVEGDPANVYKDLISTLNNWSLGMR